MYRLATLTLIGGLFYSLLGAYQAREIHTIKEFKELNSTQKRPVVLFFYAPWCSACKAMKDPFNQVAEHYKNESLMVKINIENKALKDIINAFSIDAIPTFYVKHTGVMGKEQLQNMVQAGTKKSRLQSTSS